MGKTYGNNGNFSKTLSIVNRLIDSATVHQDPYLHYCALQLKSYALINDKKYSMAHAVLTEICNSGFAECTDSLNLCRVLAHTRQTNDALTLLEKTSDNDPGFKRMVRYLIYSKNKQFDKAIKEGEVVDNIADSILRVSMSRNIAGTISEYFEMKKKFSETELEVSRLRTWILIIVFIVTVCTLTVITIYVYRRQKHEIDQKVLFAGQLQKELKYNRQDLDRIIKNLDKTKDDLAKSKEDLNKTKGDLAKSKEDLSKTKKDLVKSNEDLNKTKEDLAKSNEDLSKTKGDLAKSKEDLNKTKEDLAKSKEDLSKTKEDLAKSNEDLNKTKDDLAKSIQHLDTSKNENKHAFDVIKFLWSTKYELLEQLAEINIYNTDSKVMRQKIADIVSKLIDDFKHHSDKTVELENNVDLLYTIVR